MPISSDSDLTHFITFYKEIPANIPPRDYHHFSIGSYQFRESPDDAAAIERYIKRFESDHHVTNWKEIAHHYKITEVNYP